MLPAEVFIEALTGHANTAVTFQTFDDRGKAKDLAHVFSGPFKTFAASLEKLNAQGAGIFLTINETDLQGRKKANVLSLRALFIDIDRPELPAFPCPPSIVVRSGRGWHVYWLLREGEPLDAFEPAQKHLIRYYDSDPKVHDLPRVMRLPGFLWHKEEPARPIEITESHPERIYPLDDVLAAHPLEAPAPKVRRIATGPASDHPLHERIKRASAYLAKIPAAVSGQNGHGDTWKAALAVVRGFSLPGPVALDLLASEYNSRCSPPWSDRELQHKVDSALNDAKVPDGYLLKAREVRPRIARPLFSGSAPSKTPLFSEVPTAVPAADIEPESEVDNSGEGPLDNSGDDIRNSGEPNRGNSGGRFGPGNVFRFSPGRSGNPAGRPRLNGHEHAEGVFPGARQAISPDAPWQDKLIFKQGQNGAPGRLEPLLHNSIVILENDPRWNGVLAWDEFASRIHIQDAPPFGTGADRAVRDDDFVRIAAWLQSVWDLYIGSDIAAQAAQAVSRSRAFHPVRQYLETLTWDEVPRLDTWLEDVCGAPTSPYIRAVGRCWLMSAVARILRPGCKADQVLVLEGPQGVKKSTILKILGGPWFTDELDVLGSKDAAMQLQGAWIIEMAELDALSRTEISRVKAFIAKSDDRFRPPYGRTIQRFPRQCIFAGTVNHATYLRDETGNRRFWPVETKPPTPDGYLDVEGLIQMRDQLFAEAVHIHKTEGDQARWWLTDMQTISAAMNEQEDRVIADPWEDPIQDYLFSQMKDAFGIPFQSALRDRVHVSVREVLTKACNVPIERQGQTEMNRVVRCLKRLRWVRKRIFGTDAEKPWRYFPGPFAANPPDPYTRTQEDSDDPEN